jgi:hypothetical protein
MAQHGHEDIASGSTADQGRGVVEEAKGAARDVIGEARAAGSSVAREAAGLGSTIKQGLSNQVEQQKNGIADRIGAVAERAQRAADELQDQEAWLGNLLGRGARELQGVAGDIRNNDVAGLIGSAEVFARRQPALFMGAAVALGFALTRVVRAGSEASGGYRQDRSYGSGPSRPEPYSPGLARPEGAYGVGGGSRYGTAQGATGVGTVSPVFEDRDTTGPAVGGSNI